jgi:hypothetical protein
MRSSQMSLQRLDLKLKEKNSKHESELNRVISEARMRNHHQLEKVTQWKEWREKMELEEMKRLWESE